MSCTLCGFSKAEHEYTGTDESGGMLLYLCDWCHKRIQQDRCKICGKRIVGVHKAESLFSYEGDGPFCEGAYCDDCRTDIINNSPIGGVSGSFSIGTYSRINNEDDDIVKEEMKYRNVVEG